MDERERRRAERGRKRREKGGKYDLGANNHPFLSSSPISFMINSGAFFTHEFLLLMQAAAQSDFLTKLSTIPEPIMAANTVKEIAVDMR